MTTSAPQATQADEIGPIEQAEAAWLAALTDGEEAMRGLMHEDCLVVHGPVGKIDERESFASFAANRRKTVFASTQDVSITRRGHIAIVTCRQEMHIFFAPDLPPFPVEEAVTRVWEATGQGWRLAHMHQSKRQPPA